MKEELYEILGELSDIKGKLESIIYVTTILEKQYESQNEFELFSIVHVMLEYLKSLEDNVTIVVNEVDKLELRCSHTDEIKMKSSRDT